MWIDVSWRQQKALSSRLNARRKMFFNSLNNLQHILFQVIHRHNVESEDSANIMNLKMAAFHPW